MAGFIRSLVLLMVLGGCFQAMPASAQTAPDRGQNPVGFAPPTDYIRFYHLVAQISPASSSYTITAATINHENCLFVPLIDGKMWQNEFTKEGGSINATIPTGKAVDLCIRYPWTASAEHNVEIALEDGKSGSLEVLKTQSISPAEKAYPFPGWKQHRLLVLSEDFGIPRKDEPHTTVLQAEKNEVASWERELRVAHYNLNTGEVAEVPSQVLSEKTLADTPKGESVYTTCQLAFLADVPENSKGYYLLFFSNPEATTPDYQTDLGYGPDDQGEEWIENSYYKASLHPESGQLNGFFTKVFGKEGTPGLLSERYPVHYNPDVWVRGRNWSHVSDWNPPPNTRMVSGPVAVVARRWGPLPWVPEVECEVVYTFFNNNPYFFVSSTLDIKQDLVVNALRNEEVIAHPETEIDHVAWRRPNGDLRYKKAELEPGLSRGMLGIIEAEAPYVCLIREPAGFGMAAIRLKEFAGSRGEDPPVIASTMTVLADYGWHFRYWSRSLVYPWGDKVPDQPTILNADTFYCEESAYCLFPVMEGNAPAQKLDFLQGLYEKLQSPLREDKQGTGPW